MRGRSFVIGFLLFAALFAVALWYVQTRAWYRDMPATASIAVAGREVPVTDFRGIDAPSPLKRRGCFRVDPALLAGAPVAEDATPLSAPGWFDCFDHARLTLDLAAGRARAVLATTDDPEDFETIIAVYPDGAGYLWRQLKAEFRN